MQEINNILGNRIIKGRNNINGSRPNKFLSFVENIIKSPIAETIAGPFPVIGSIKSVVDLVTGTAIRGDDIKVDDLVELKSDLKKFITHYQGLGQANIEFINTLSTLKNRSRALDILLKQYTIERLNSIIPNSISKTDTFGVHYIVNNFYKKEAIEGEITKIEEFHTNKEGNIQYNKILDNPKLHFPAIAENQARVIKDEILAISKEYITAYNSYQNSIEKVLQEAIKNQIGDKSNIEGKISSLRASLKSLELSFKDGVNTDDLNSEYDKILNLR